MNAVVLERDLIAIPTSEELVARAAAMVPQLRARADEIEKARKVPSDVIEMFKEAGFFRILQPKQIGRASCRERV